ncbi:MAG: GntP family permease [Brevinema sp.]
MDFTISYIGALLGLLIAIIGIIRKYPPVYSLILGALLGGLLGGASITQTVSVLILGASGIISAVLRILTAGVLVGVLVKTGATTRISLSITKLSGEKNILGIYLSLIISAVFLTAIGVFIDITVITLAPIALNIAKQTRISRGAVLLALIGGGKAGNMISPNPNTITAAEAFNVDLFSLMTANFIPALVAIAMTLLLTSIINKTNPLPVTEDMEDTVDESKLPSLFQALIAPIVAITILALRPIANITIDPLIALPLGGIIGSLVMGKIKNINEQIEFGLSRMGGIALLLLGTGCIAGIIKSSNLTDVVVNQLHSTGISASLLAPISGILMSFVTASTTAGTAVASNTFGELILATGIAPLGSAAMVHTGATVLDHMPHGSFFHATGGSANMDFKNRLMLIPYESMIGLSMALTAWIMYGR